MQKNIVESSDIVNHAVNQFHDFFSSESKVLVFTMLRLSEQFHENSVKHAANFQSKFCQINAISNNESRYKLISRKFSFENRLITVHYAPEIFKMGS